MSPRILIVHTGGTLGMTPSGEPLTLSPGANLSHLMESMPELERLAELRLYVACNRDSSTLEPEHILDLARIIREEGRDSDGVVLIHGTDTMACTASLLGLLLADLGKPVVITGSQRPLAYVRSDARSNIVDAVTLAARGVAEVGICFGELWLRGVAAEKLSVHRYQAFESPNLPPLAELGLYVQMHPHAGIFERRVPPGLGSRLETAISMLSPFPGMDWHLPDSGARAVVIQAFGAGNLPMGRSDLRAMLAHCREREMPVVIASQCPSGGVDLGAYELGREAAELGAISGGRQTRWTILAKLGLLLGADRGLPEIRQAFATSWAGEPL